jgi:hypothetical protein
MNLFIRDKRNSTVAEEEFHPFKVATTLDDIRPFWMNINFLGRIAVVADEDLFVTD